MPEFIASAANVTHAFRNNLSSFFINPAVPAVTGIPTTSQASEFETNWKNLSEGSLSDEFMDLRILISRFCENSVAGKNNRINTISLIPVLENPDILELQIILFKEALNTSLYPLPVFQESLSGKISSRVFRSCQ